ncbi:BLUF domain-containing protein [Aquimarina sp. RZ0]|uniref:BLUF domain-containing protein n=1 Tax=Aquimarina sp. RZ0 TaxID=2607730 RepID=UPI0011F197B2|nr:BLUF domain-containing protein [Aquimarina sp. RZ0]KAA1248096.1 BLUF domain-containing protein [Aquimarina sp. RZ0]
MIKGIVYVSKAIVDFNSDDLKKLETFASDCNKQFGITGYLYFEKGFFLQYIEGDDAVVDVLMNNIKQDTRHTVLSYKNTTDIISRKFPAWYMRKLTKSSLIQINMENVLIDYMTDCNKKRSMELNSESVWRMVNKLSGFRKKI